MRPCGHTKKTFGQIAQEARQRLEFMAVDFESGPFLSLRPGQA